MTTPDLNMSKTALNAEELAAQEQGEIERRNEIEALTGIADDQIPPADPIDDGEPAPRTPAEPEPDAKPIPMSPGDAARAAIAAKLKRTDSAPFDGDMTKDENLYGDVARVTLEPDPDLDEPGANANEPAARAPAPTDPDQEPITRNVRGKPVTKTRAEWLEQAMKVESGDSYLQDARTLLEEAKNLKNGTATGDSQRPDGQRQQDNEPDPNAPAPRHPGDKRREVIEQVQFGDPDQAGEVLDDYIGERVVKAIEDGQLKRLKDNDLARSQKAIREFTAANPELAADEEAVQLLENRTYKIYRDELVNKLGLEDAVVPRDPKQVAEWARHFRAQGAEISTAADVLNMAKDHVVKRLGIASSTSTTPAAKPRGEPSVTVDVRRSERRAAIPSQPTRAVAPKPNAQAQAPAKKTQSEIVADMRRARGQPVAT